MTRIDRWLGLPETRFIGLNWKGRLIERQKVAGKAIRRALVYVVFLVLNTLCFWAWWLVRGRRREAIRSVLQLSLLSHKPFMLSRTLREQGIKSDFLALNVGSGGGILDMGFDYAIPANVSPLRRRLLEFWYMWTVLVRYDVIHSHFRSFLSETGWELPYLRRLGIVLVFHARGCDVRHRSLNMRLQPELNCCQECDYPVGSCDTDYQYQKIAMMRHNGDVFFATTPDLIDFLPGAEHIPFIHPVGVDFDGVQPAARPQPEVFRVVTSSNHHGVDGTRYIRDAVARLKSEGRSIELIEVSKMPYREALSVYKSADVYVGKLRMGYYNNANIETMMMGVPNMSYIRDEFRSIAPDCPVIVTRPDTVYRNLHYYMDHRDELKAIGAKGPAFVRAEHDPARLVRRMIDHYNRALCANNKPKDDVHPITVVRREDPEARP